MTSLSDRRRRAALYEVEKLESLVGADYWRNGPFDGADIFWRFERFFTVHPQRRAARRDAAVRQAGRFVLYEACGLWAYEAFISGSYSGWFGCTRYGRRPGLERPQNYDAEELLCFAHAMLAGPLAEDQLGGRNLLDSVADVAEARILAHLAERSNGRGSETWREVVLRTAALVELHAYIIKDIADRLESRKHVDRAEPSVDEIMGRMGAASVDPVSASDRALEILQDITDAMKELGL